MMAILTPRRGNPMPAQGNALGIKILTSQALKGRSNRTRVWSALSGLVVPIAKSPGRCPGLHWVAPLAHKPFRIPILSYRGFQAPPVRSNCTLALAGPELRFVWQSKPAMLRGMNVTLPISEMSTGEKLFAMEALWAALTRDADACDSPAWHGGVLRERDRRVAGGGETYMKREDAKRELRGHAP